MDIRTIDEQIREKAKGKLERRINEALGGLTSGPGSIIDFPQCVKFTYWRDASGNYGVTGQTMIRALKDGIYHHLEERVADAAVAAFLAKVDGIQSQLDELRETVESTPQE